MQNPQSRGGQKVLAVGRPLLSAPGNLGHGRYVEGRVQEWKFGVLDLEQLRKKTCRIPLKGQSWPYIVLLTTVINH